MVSAATVAGSPSLGSPALARTVDAFWAFESAGTAHRILPDGCIDFIFDLDAGRARVQGPMTRAEVVLLPPGRRLFGVRFLPGAASAFMDADAHALEDGDTELEEVTNACMRRLAEQVAEAADHGGRRRIVTEFLLDPRARQRAVDARLPRAVHIIRQRRGTAPVAVIARELGCSERTLERLFRDHVGLAPKLFARIMRMEWTRGAAGTHRASQADLALRGGYADEPHLLRDFRALTGLTPGALLAEERVGFVQVGAPVSA